MSYTIVPVTTFKQALQLRKLRNECRQFMTRDQSYIHVLRQWNFWRQYRNVSDWKAYLLYREGIPLAFGVINGNEITGGVTKKWRGQGLGKMMFKFLTDEVPKPALLEVQAENDAAWGLYESLGWTEDYYNLGIVTMVKHD